MTYRIRQPNDCVGCIMASYGSQHEFSEENLLTKGLFGSLLQDGDRVRFFSGAEVSDSHDAMSDCLFYQRTVSCT